MSSTTKIFLTLVALVGAGVGYFVIQQNNAAEGSASGKTGAAKGKGAGGGMRIVTVETTESRIGRINERVALTGALKPKEQVDVTPKTAGRVVRLHVDDGDTVRKDTLIV